MSESEPIHILYMEDDPGLARLFEKRLERAGYVVDVAHDGEEGLAMWAAGAYGVLAVDQQMPVYSGLDVIRILASQGPLPPTIMITGTGSERTAVEAMKLGAVDYVVKDADGGYLDLLPTVIEQVLQQRRLVEERQQALDALRESEACYRSLFDGMPVGLYRSTPEGQLLDANPALVEMPSYQDREVLVADNAADLYVDAENRRLWRDLMERDGVVHGFEVRFRRRDGAVIWVQNTARVVRDAEGRVLYYEGSIEDISERVQAEEVRARLEEELRRAHERIQQELDLAAEVQSSLLPRHVPSLDGFDFAATALPARYVSGDLYDFILSDPETCHIVLADIAGKGVPAALLTSTARTLLRAETEHEDSPATVLSSVNTSLYEDLTHAEMFITFLAARLDVRLGTLTYANAGHTETLWWQRASRTCRTLPATGLPMGIYADLSILEETLALRPGDALVFYSDGITEAANPHDELFGLDRLIATVGTHVHLSASELAQAIVKAVEAFRAGAPLSDDLTLIVLKVLPRTISFAYPATLDHLNEITTLVQQVASAYGSDFAYQMELATSEIVTNVIEHAYRLSSGEMRGQITLSPDQIQLDLYDDGTPFDPSQVPASDLTEELQDRGRGLFVARQLTDELTYNPATPEGNHWRLVKLAGSFIRNLPDSPGNDP